jgi:hypothetical protein
VLLAKLQASGKKIGDDVYLFVRQLSTYQSLHEQKSLNDFSDCKIYELVHKFLDQEQHAKVLNDLMPEETKEKKKKKKSKKETENSEVIQGDNAAKEQEEDEKSGKKKEKHRQRKNRKKAKKQ